MSLFSIFYIDNIQYARYLLEADLRSMFFSEKHFVFLDTVCSFNVLLERINVQYNCVAKSLHVKLVGAPVLQNPECL